MERRKAPFLLTVFMLMLVFAMPVCASSAKKNKWVKTDQCYKYYNKKGKAVKGIKTIGKKTYYFDSKRIQRTGWRKIKGKYYFFNIGNKTKGYMVTNKKVNGIKLNKKGIAVLKNDRAREKVELMCRYAEWADALTKPSWKKSKKLLICYDYLRRSKPYMDGPDFRMGDSDWDLYYAENALEKSRNDCFESAAGMAYLANAIGYTDVKLCMTTGHGWAEIDGKVYDVSYGRGRDYDGYTYFGLEKDAEHSEFFSKQLKKL